MPCSTLCREPSFGHFNKDGILDVVVEDEIGHYKKRVGVDAQYLVSRTFFYGDLIWIIKIIHQ